MNLDSNNSKKGGLTIKAIQFNKANGISRSDLLIYLAFLAILIAISIVRYQAIGWLGVFQVMGGLAVFILLLTLMSINEDRETARMVLVTSKAAEDAAREEALMIENSLNLTLEKGSRAVTEYLNNYYPGNCIIEEDILERKLGWNIPFGTPTGDPEFPYDTLIPGPSVLFFNKHTGNIKELDDTDDNDSLMDWMTDDV